MPSSITGTSSRATTSASSSRRRGGIVVPSGLCSVGWTYSARTGPAATSDSGISPASSISIGTSSTPSRAASPFTTGYVSDSTASRSPTGTNAAIAAAMACLPLPVNRTLADGQAAPHQVTVDAGGGGVRDAALPREAALRRKPVAGTETAGLDVGGEGVRDDAVVVHVHLRFLPGSPSVSMIPLRAGRPAT